VTEYIVTRKRVDPVGDTVPLDEALMSLGMDAADHAWNTCTRRAAMSGVESFRVLDVTREEVYATLGTLRTEGYATLHVPAMYVYTSGRTLAGGLLFTFTREGDRIITTASMHT
jgi:hypothetical protein